MNEHEMLERVQVALVAAGVEDQVTAAAIFLPRGHFGGAFAGGLIGGDIVGGGIGAAGGALAGMKAVDAASNMPERCVVGVSATRVYGFDSERGHGGRVPTRLVFSVDRESIEVKVHQRFNVRVLELIHQDGTTIELEGPRLDLGEPHRTHRGRGVVRRIGRRETGALLTGSCRERRCPCMTTNPRRVKPWTCKTAFSTI